MKERFNELKEIWKNDTRFLSDSNKIINHPAYLEIINMGKQVLPFIIDDMRETNNHWFVALEIITGVKPVLIAHYGNIPLMVNDWLNWADNNLESYMNRYFFIGFSCKFHTTNVIAGTGVIFYNKMPSYNECVEHIYSIQEEHSDMHSVSIISISEFKNEQDYKTFVGL